MTFPFKASMTLLALAATAVPALSADQSQQLQQLRLQIEAMKKDYESRLKALELRLDRAQAQPKPPPIDAAAAPLATVPVASAPTVAATHQPAPAVPVAAAPVAANGFNPALSLILSGTYATLSQDPKRYHISGFLAGDEIGPGVKGFSLGESELAVSASVDPWFSGSLNLALAADNSASVEEAYVDTTALPAGLRLRMGRYLSAIGYENSKHAHTWDFVDAPLVYQAFLNGALKQDGVQLSTLLPTAQYVELGGGLGAAGPYPSGGESRNQPGTATLFAHTGGDIGFSQSWRAGASLLWARSDGRTSDSFDASANPISTSFTGTTRLAILDGVWKWAPNGNAQRTNLKLQGEYFWRNESGSLVYDSDAAALADSYRSVQAGWYAQTVYQFMPSWRIGARYDRLDIGNVDAASNTSNLYLPAYAPSRATLMIDWSPSEFSRVRLQYANDRARYGLTDNQFFIQYQMSLGTHGAHDY